MSEAGSSTPTAAPIPRFRRRAVPQGRPRRLPMTNDTTPAERAKKIRRPPLTKKRADAIAAIAADLRAKSKSDARIGRGTFWGMTPTQAAIARTFLEYADEIASYRAKVQP
jgi:hypothetical protein